MHKDYFDYIAIYIASICSLIVQTSVCQYCSLIVLAKWRLAALNYVLRRAKQ